jgi:mycothiol synthase
VAIGSDTLLPMHLVEIVRGPTGSGRAAATGFVDEVTAATGTRPLSDHLWLDLRSDDGSPLVVTVSDPGGVLGMAQISAANISSSLEVVLRPGLDAADALAIRDDVVETAIDAFRAAGGGTLSWWVDEPADRERELAAAQGLLPDRALHEMRRGLPADLHADVATRAFEPGVDDDAWLAVNNRAFAAHAEQGGWTRSTLAARLAEPWFDAEGFRLHERDGRLAAFCWTKLHEELDPVIGEIYVIAVDPDYHGLGLGKQLTLAGLDSIATRGVDIANLYVDADNAAAVALYDRLGFTIHRTRQVFVGHQPDTSTDDPPE